MHLRPIQESAPPDFLAQEFLAREFTGIIRRIMARNFTAMDLIAAAESLTAQGAADLVCQIYRS